MYSAEQYDRNSSVTLVCLTVDVTVIVCCYFDVDIVYVVILNLAYFILFSHMIFDILMLTII